MDVRSHEANAEKFFKAHGLTDFYLTVLGDPPATELAESVAWEAASGAKPPL